MAVLATAAEPMRLLLLALLVCTAGASLCDTAVCGKGNCTEMPGLIPGVTIPGVNFYKCNCDPGWSQPLDFFPFSPCIVPNCSFDGSCFNLNQSQTSPKGGGVPTDVCFAVNCGAGGACKAGDALLSYSCECQPGYTNMLNLAALPCVKSCFSGKGCSALGLAPPTPSSQPPHPLSPPPTEDHDSSGTSAPPSGTKGSVSSRRLLQLLLLVTLNLAQIM
ncbi:unnamed protein product [Urochloa humidicola]